MPMPLLKNLLLTVRVLVAILFSPLGWRTAFAFLVGALCSGTAGYLGMYTATKSNVRTTTAASGEGAATALTVAFFGGSIMGLCVASMGLLGADLATIDLPSLVKFALEVRGD